jgi:hypothetical protein
MSKRLFSILVILSALIVFSERCREVYVPPVAATNKSLLVVEGFINNGPDTTFVSLTHTFNVGVDDTTRIPPELHASVFVEGRDNSSFALTEAGNGLYETPGLSLNNAIQYRLHIKTVAGKDYVSDYVDLKVSPPIDSVNWAQVPGGVQIYVNSHDPASASHYYRWDYQQTWEINSVYYSNEQYLRDTVFPWAVDTFYTCWISGNSTNTLLGTTTSLSKDQITLEPLVLIPQNSLMISVQYSILVRQYVLTPDAYNFWLSLQKNTEQLGSIFSPQPSESPGNIHNTSDTSEQVLGYISAGSLQKMRIYITPNQIPGWERVSEPDYCTIQSIPDIPDTLFKYFTQENDLPVRVTPPTRPPNQRWDIAPAPCVDCTYFGTNVKPSFWP